VEALQEQQVTEDRPPPMRKARRGKNPACSDPVVDQEDASTNTGDRAGEKAIGCRGGCHQREQVSNWDAAMPAVSEQSAVQRPTNGRGHQLHPAHKSRPGPFRAQEQQQAVRIASAGCSACGEKIE